LSTCSPTPLARALALVFTPEVVRAHPDGPDHGVFAPLVEEFEVLCTQLEQTETIAPAGGPTIGIVTKGSPKPAAGGEELKLPRGNPVFVALGVEIDVRTVSGGETNIWWTVS
jgi:mannose-6-phosphate isomerase class I